MEPHSQRQVGARRQRVSMLGVARRFATWAAVMLAAALVASACVGGGNGNAKTTSTPSVEEVGPRRPGYLMAPNRTRLSICVDAAGGADVGSAQLESVSEALDAAFASVPEVPPEYTQPDPSVVAGCPPAISLTGERLSFDDRFFNSRIPAVNDAALLSPHRVFVYFVPDELYAASFGDAPYARASGEFLCGGGGCWDVTARVYVPSSAGSQPLAQGLVQALVLVPPPPPPTLDWLPCELGTPAPWCNRYEDHLAGELDE